ncbi:hypothetical protein [Nocardioides sp. Kera G14]|uniref:hypothetical protein n=1 Tax=Nocardioides sp. Kera G14 TaxID=2884264 RepID=UPI001D104614|nr:hypothetical protein [Nocardioides sp. Kera G14]UDY24707.1 hypothetical protein LH076_05225 [Nocardioides sp. Kera G14]
MALSLRCPCGERIVDFNDTFVETVQKHLSEAHEGRSYDADQIMAFAMPTDDKNVPAR